MAQLTAEQRALLEAIAGPESKGDYNVLYGGGQFGDYSDHPRQYVEITSGPNKGQKSSAAGKYQFLGSTWDDIASRHDIPDFSPQSQDLGAWYLAAEEYKRDTGRDLQSDLSAGDLSRVAPSLKNQWTSLPGGIEQGIGGSAFANAYSAALGGPTSPAMGYAPTPAPRSQNPALRGIMGAMLPDISQPGMNANGVGGMPKFSQLGGIMGAKAPAKSEAWKPGGLLGMAWNNISGGLGNLANSGGQQAQDIMGAAGNVGGGLMKAANPMGTIAGRSAIIDTALKQFFTGSPLGTNDPNVERSGTKGNSIIRSPGGQIMDRDGNWS